MCGETVLYVRASAQEEFSDRDPLKKRMCAEKRRLEAELYYVREGVVNTYAMNFVVPVPASIADLEFSWQSLVGHPVRMSGRKRF
ncbi:hypothetical protein P5V15_003779 [Pogonomyrmex californicus]